MRIEFKLPDLEPVEIDDDFEIVSEGYRRQLVSNNRIAFEILGRGRKRDRLLAAYEQEQGRLLKAKPVVAVEHLRETVYTEEVAEIANVAPPIIQIDEQAETEVFFETLAAEEAPPFIPRTDEWFDCTLKDKLHNSYSAILELSNGQLVWCHERDFTVRNAGHSLCQKGAKAVVRIEKNLEARRYEFRALECQLIVDGEEKESHVTGEITHWTGSLGSARMGCGCSLQIATASRYEELELAVGDHVEFDVVWKDKLQKWVGCL